MLVSGVGVQYWVQQQQTARACDQFGAQLRERWSDATRAELDAALRQSGLSFADDTADRLLPRLDDYAAALHEQGRAICRAESIEGTLSAELYERAKLCVEERQAAMGTMLDSIDPARVASLERSLTLVAKLPTIDPCGDRAELESPSLMLPSDPDERSAVSNLKIALASLSLDPPPEQAQATLAEGRRLLAEAESLGWAPAVALALTDVATLEHVVGAQEQSYRTHARAFEVSVAAEREDLAAINAAQAAVLATDVASSIESADIWAKVARALASGTSTETPWKLHVVAGGGSVAMRKHDFEACVDAFTQAEDLATRVLSPHHPFVAQGMVNRSSCLLSMGRWDEGFEVQRKALDRLVDLYGLRHPMVAVTRLNRAIALKQRGRYDEALAAADEAYDVLSELSDSDGFKYRAAISVRAGLLQMLGRWSESLEEYNRITHGQGRHVLQQRIERATVLAHLGRIEQARAEAQQVFAQLSSELDEEDPTLARADLALAEVLLLADDSERALHHARSGMKRLAKTDGKNAQFADYLRVLADAQLRRGERAAALETVGRSLELWADHPPDNPFAALARFVLAQAVYPDDPARARALAQRASTALRRSGEGFFGYADRIDAWLAEPSAALVPAPSEPATSP